MDGSIRLWNCHSGVLKRIVQNRAARTSDRYREKELGSLLHQSAKIHTHNTHMIICRKLVSKFCTWWCQHGSVSGVYLQWSTIPPPVCPAVIFQPFFTVDSSRYFKRSYSESSAKSSPSSVSTTPSPTKSPSSAAGGKGSPPSRPPPPSHPPPTSKRASEKNLTRMGRSPDMESANGRGDAGGETPLGEGEGMGGWDGGRKVAASPATGQVHSMTQQSPEGVDGKSMQHSLKSGHLIC